MAVLGCWALFLPEARFCCRPRREDACTRWFALPPQPFGGCWGQGFGSSWWNCAYGLQSLRSTSFCELVGVDTGDGHLRLVLGCFEVEKN